MRTRGIRAIEELALSDPDVIVVASDPNFDFMQELSAKHPERFLVEGVCEQGLMGMSAGLAAAGYYPFIATLAVFGTRRCYEQLLLDFGLHCLRGCVVGIGGGLTYAPLGPTHIAVDDMMLFSAIPGSAVLAPADPAEAIALVWQARRHPGLSFLRLSGTTASLKNASGDIILGKGRLLAEAGPVLFISSGTATLAVEQAVALLQDRSIQAGALHIHTVKPLDVALVRRCVQDTSVVICVDEHRQIGGLSSAVLHALSTADPPVWPARFVTIGVDDTFPTGYGSYEDLMQHYGMTGELLAERAQAALVQASGLSHRTSARIANI